MLPYGFAIHGCVDGYINPIIVHIDHVFSIYRFSRKVLWMEVSPTNKNASIVGGYYLSAVERYGKGTMIPNYTISQ